jgi:hypothetical protein
MIFLILVFTVIFKNSDVVGRMAFMLKLSHRKKRMLFYKKKMNPLGFQLILKVFSQLSFLIIKAFSLLRIKNTTLTQKQFP